MLTFLANLGRQTLRWDYFRFACDPTGIRTYQSLGGERIGAITLTSGFAYFSSSAVKFVTTVKDWLTCCETRSKRIFLPSPAERTNCTLRELEKEGVETELVELGGLEIHGCRACRKCSVRKNRRCSQENDMGNVCIEKMDAADGILLGSPTYVADVSPEIKALMDRACLVSKANGGMFRHKVGAGVVAVRRAGAMHAFDALNHFFLISEMIVPGSSYWNIGIGREPGDVEKDEEGIQTMKALGQNMAWLLRKIHAQG